MKFTVERFRLIGITVLSVLLFTLVGAASLSPAYATSPTLTVSTATPIFGQTFQFYGTDPNPGAFPVSLYIGPSGIPNPGCNVDDIVAHSIAPYNPFVIATGPSFTVTVTAGSPFVVGTTYCAFFLDSVEDTVFEGSSMVTFTIHPVTKPQYYPVGGVMLPSVGLTVLLPWAVLLSSLGVVSVEALIVRRRAKRT